MTLISYDICHVSLQLYTQTILVFLYNYTQIKKRSIYEESEYKNHVEKIKYLYSDIRIKQPPEYKYS